ncbi:MAG: serine hydrolase domain-containing protein [Erythrobacter sp.]
MFRVCASIAFVAAALFITAPALARPANIAAIDALVDAQQHEDAPGISVAISVDGAVVYENWTGLADIERGVPIDRDTRFHIASISKQFTAFAIMLLRDEGRLTLDQDIRDFLPEMAARAQPVTIRHLLNHTSGLREANSLLLLTGQSPDAPIYADQSLDLIYRQSGGNFAAGTRQEYSNTGYQLLAEIVERISGQPFAQFMEDRIFEPLGMTRTFQRVDPYAMIDRVASSYEPRGDGFANAPILSTAMGSTGIVSDPRDMLRWGHALNTGTIGGVAVIDAMAARSTLPDGRRAIATNGQEYRNFRGLNTWSHGGSTGGFRSFLLRIPDEGVVITVMGNRSDFLKAAFAFDVAELFLADRLAPLPDADFEPETGEALDKYVGDYRLFAGVVFSVRRDRDQLTFATFGSEDVTVLPQRGKGVFALNPAREIGVEFHDFDAGRAVEMRWQVSDDGFIPAPRVAMQPVPDWPVSTPGLVGTYYNDALQQAVTVYDQNGQLWLRTGDAQRVALDHYQPDTFRPAGSSSVQRMAFIRNDEEEAQSVLVSTALAINIAYRRIKD